ncbi:MAG TPA: TetR/AcrR family transcriptional regulator [Capillimicrobium sp.]|jgi:AcrR family transcriptional regulator
MASQPAPARAQRADARRNRERIVAAATEALTEAGGAPVSLEAIAKRAGVGIGTLYRHFPTRDALVEEAYRHEVDLLVDSAAELLEQLPPEQALSAWTERLVTYARAKRGMAEALQSAVASGSTVHTDGRSRIVAALSEIIQSGQRSGALRPDADADVALRAMMAIWSMPEGPGWAEQARALLRLVVDGLRYGAGR